MKIEEVKPNLNRKVQYNGSEYILNACILRKTTGFYYQAELLSGNSVLIVGLDKVEVVNSK
jgi:hypothetical protein